MFYIVARSVSEGTVSHTTDEDNSSFTDDLSNSVPLTYIPSLTIVDEEEEIMEEYREHDMPGEFTASLSHNLLDVTTEDIKTICCNSSFKTNVIFPGGFGYIIRRRDVRR